MPMRHSTTLRRSLMRHTPMPTSPLSPRRTCTSGPYLSLMRAWLRVWLPDCRDDRAVFLPHFHSTSVLDANTQSSSSSSQPTISTSDTARTDDQAANSSRPSILILFRSYHTPSLPLIPRCTMRVVFFCYLYFNIFFNDIYGRYACTARSLCERYVSVLF